MNRIGYKNISIFHHFDEISIFSTNVYAIFAPPKIAAIQKVLLGAKKSQQKGSVSFEKASVQGKQVQMVEHCCRP